MQDSSRISQKERWLVQEDFCHTKKDFLGAVNASLYQE